MVCTESTWNPNSLLGPRFTGNTLLRSEGSPTILPAMLVRILSFSLLVSSAVIAEEGEFTVGEGLQVSPAVEDGLVRFPMMATLDDRGRLFVAENGGVNLNRDDLLAQKPSLIRLLEDTNRDGVYDKATVFADGLTFPQGALWIYDSLYVMSPPNLWRLSDRDGDGRAETREELVTGFDFTGNAADVHGPFLHPNGRIYWCHGRKNFAIPDSDDGQILYRGKGARIWSSTLSGSEVEPFAGGGMDNPVEIDFTERGEILGTVNLFYGRPRGDTLTHWVHGGAYPRIDQPQAMIGLPRTGPLLREVHNFGHVAISGMCRYRSGSLDPSWKDQWLVSHFNTARITQTRLVRTGASFLSAKTETVFEIHSPDAHLTDVLEDYNGDLLAIDTGGWFRNGCPTSHLAKPEVTGMLYRISKKGSEFAPIHFPDWNQLTAEQVAGFLGESEFAFQDRAILELAERGDPAIPELRRLLQDPGTSVQSRRNAIWTLSRMKFSQSIDLIYDALVDPAPSVRQAAANAISVTRSWQSIAANEPAEREIELERNRTISGALARIVRSDEPAVAKEAATALGKMGETRAMGALLGRLGRVEEDPVLRHALVYALIEIDDPEATRIGLESENPLLLSGVLQALDQIPSTSLKFLEVLPHFDSEDEQVRSAAIQIAASQPTWDAALANRFFLWKDEMTSTRKEVMNQLVPIFASSPPMQGFMTAHLGGTETDLRQTLEWLKRAEETTILPTWRAPLAKILQRGPDSPDFESVVELVRRQSGKELVKELDRWVGDGSLPRWLRVQLIQARSAQQAVLTAPAFDLLIKILETEEESLVRMKSLQALTASRLTVERKTQLAERMGNFSVPELVFAMGTFRKIDSPEQASALADSLASSPGFSRFDPDRLRQLFRPHGGPPLEQIENRIAKAKSESEDRARKMEQILGTMDRADPENGRELFQSGAGSCLICHRVGETGGLVGPDLTSIGSIRGARDILESILYPDVSIARDFDTVEVFERGIDGSSRIGLLESDGLDSIRLIDAAGQSVQIPRSQIESIVSLERSLMPPGLEHTLPENGVRDIVAYLLQQSEKKDPLGQE